MRILEQVASTGQSEGRAKDLTNMLTDNSFPRVNYLGAGLKDRDQNCILGSQEGTSTGKVGDPSTEVLTPNQVSPAGGVTRNSTSKTLETQPKGKEPQVSQDHSSPRNSWSQSDPSVLGWEQVKKHKPSCLNPQHSQAL